MQALLIIIGTVLYLAGFIAMLKAAYAAEDDIVFFERDYISCWLIAIVWPLSLVVLLTIFSFSFVHDRLRR